MHTYTHICTNTQRWVKVNSMKKSDRHAGCKTVFVRGYTCIHTYIHVHTHTHRWVKVNSMKKSDRPAGCKTVFVGGLAFDIDEEKLREHFGSCGSINTIRWGEDKTTGDFKGYAHIVFDEEEAVDAAMGLTGSELLGRSLRVDFAMDVRSNNNNKDGDRRQSNDRGGGRVSVLCVCV
jgi:RNA recognition motif-containing protein